MTEIEVRRFECLNVQPLGADGTGQRCHSFEPLGYGYMVLLCSADLTRYRLAFAGSDAVDFHIGGSMKVGRTKAGMCVVVGEDEGEKLLVTFHPNDNGKAESDRLEKAISQIIETLSKNSGPAAGSS